MILAATDLSAGGRVAIARAGVLAKRRNQPLAVVCVIDHLPGHIATTAMFALEFDPLEVGRLARNATRSSLEETVATLVPDFDDVELYVRTGSAVDAIIELADDINATMICVGRSGAGFIERSLLGTTAERVMRSANRPVMLAPAGDASPASRILVPFDLGPCGDEQLRQLHALDLDSAPNILLLGVTATPTYFADIVGDPAIRVELVNSLTRELVAGVEERAKQIQIPGATVRTLVVEGDPARQILSAAREHGCDTIVIGTRNRRGLQRVLIGNTVERVARRFEGVTITAPSPEVVASYATSNTDTETI